MSLLPIVEIGAKLLDKLIPDPAAKAAAQIKLVELAQAGVLTELSERSGIIKTEAGSTHWITATWRPITMLTFTALIVARWLGWSAPGLSEAEVLKLWDIVQLGLGGYVIGRSAEKIVPAMVGKK